MPKMEDPKAFLDVEIYDPFGPDHWAQARFLVHGWDDVLWTNDIEQVALFLETHLKKMMEELELTTKP